MSVVQQLMQNDDVVALAITTFASFVGFLLRKANLSKKAQENVNLGIEIAYGVVTNEKLTQKVQHLDKGARGLEVLREYLATHGQEPTEADLARARLVFAAKHAAEKQGAQ